MRRTTKPEGQAAPTAARAEAATATAEAATATAVAARAVAGRAAAEREEGMVAVMETEAQLPLQLHH